MNPLQDQDPFLRRVMRTTLMLCGVTGLAALAIGRGNASLGLGVLAGTGLMAFSFKVIRDTVDARSRPAADGQQEAPAWTLLKFVGRYAVLAVAGWAALVPLHASPIGLFVGVMVPVAAIVITVLRKAK